MQTHRILNGLSAIACIAALVAVYLYCIAGFGIVGLLLGWLPALAIASVAYIVAYLAFVLAYLVFTALLA